MREKSQMRLAPQVQEVTTQVWAKVKAKAGAFHSQTMPPARAGFDGSGQRGSGSGQLAGYGSASELRFAASCCAAAAPLVRRCCVVPARGK
jgi:hypothetical protein